MNPENVIFIDDDTDNEFEYEEMTSMDNMMDEEDTFSDASSTIEFEYIPPKNMMPVDNTILMGKIKTMQTPEHNPIPTGNYYEEEPTTKEEWEEALREVGLYEDEDGLHKLREVGLHEDEEEEEGENPSNRISGFKRDWPFDLQVPEIRREPVIRKPIVLSSSYQNETTSSSSSSSLMKRPRLSPKEYNPSSSSSAPVYTPAAAAPDENIIIRRPLNRRCSICGRWGGCE